LVWFSSVTAFAGPRPIHRVHARTPAVLIKAAQRRPGKELPPPKPSATAPRVVADPSDPHEQRIQVLRDQLSATLADLPLRRTRVGMQVVAASDGDVLFAHNAEKLFNPASNTKMLTTAAALTHLGGDYRYATTLHGPEPDIAGVIHGDVELRGSGDPSLSTNDIGELARAVAARGITRIEGGIVASGRFRDPAHPSEAVGEGALILNRNTFTVRVRPTEPGHHAVVDVQPALPEWVVIENGVTTVGGKKKTRIRYDQRRDQDGVRLVVTARGRVNERSDDWARRRLPDGTLYAAATLRRALTDFGVDVTGSIRAGQLPGDAPLVAEHHSAPLSEICRVSNKESNNFVAEAIFKTVGGELFGLPGTLDKGTRAVDELLTPLGIPVGSYTIENGSGLTHANRIQPSALTKLLRNLHFDLAVAPEFEASLAVGGIDGTIRGRFLGTDAVGLVRAKTGTLDSVSALSGYVGDTGDVLIFSIFVEGFRHRTLAAIRHAQVRMVEAMLAYLRADKAAPHPGDGQPIPGGPTEDSESDGDPTMGGE
jgi:D-alanyl-D-alanine carboxypeptidase/D-alanyl-D-alanine-endopeptidase (penicillin-binding protein 4)